VPAGSRDAVGEPILDADDPVAHGAVVLSLVRELVPGADDVGREVGHSVPVEVEADETVEAGAGVGVDETGGDALVEPRRRPLDGIVRADEDLDAGGGGFVGISLGVS